MPLDAGHLPDAPGALAAGARLVERLHGTGLPAASTLLRSVWLRPYGRGPAPGPHFVGVGTHPGAGVPGAPTSAKVVEALLRVRPAR